jgi:hypothetical protein
MIQAGPTHMAVKEDAVARESERQLLADAKGAGHLSESDAEANSALISVMVRSVMADASDDTPVHRFYPVVQDSPASSSDGRLIDGRMSELVRLAIKILSTAEDRSEAQLIAALRRAPARCPSDACHQFWLRGACDFPSCKYQHMQGPALPISATAPQQPDAGVCASFWSQGTCVNTACTLQHTHNRSRALPRTVCQEPRPGPANNPPDQSWCGNVWKTGTCVYADRCRFIHTPNG